MTPPPSPMPRYPNIIPVTYTVTVKPPPNVEVRYCSPRGNIMVTSGMWTIFDLFEFWFVLCVIVLWTLDFDIFYLPTHRKPFVHSTSARTPVLLSPSRYGNPYIFPSITGRRLHRPCCHHPRLGYLSALAADRPQVVGAFQNLADARGLPRLG